jgi:hypothetical protein
MSSEKTLTDVHRLNLRMDNYDVSGSLPEHYGSVYPKLVKFLDTYFKSLEEGHSPVADLSNVGNVRDIVNTKEEFLSYMSNELLLGESYFESFNDKRSALQYSSLLYRAKGTEYSIDQFFRTFFSVDVDVSYGREETFRIGDPITETLEYVGSAANPESRFDFTFKNGTYDVYHISGSTETLLENGLHYDIIYGVSQILLLEHEDSLVPRTQTGLLLSGDTLRITTSKKTHSAIGSEISSMKLTDNEFYQLYGLRISTPISVNIWKSAFKTFIHPAGMYLDGQVGIEASYIFGERTPLPSWQVSSGLGSMPPAFIQPPPPVYFESSAKVSLANSGLGSHNITTTEIINGPDGHRIIGRVNNQELPVTVEGWHTQYVNMAAADDINSRTMDDDLYADVSNTINNVDEEIWHYNNYLHPTDSDGSGNPVPIFGNNV